MAETYDKYAEDIMISRKRPHDNDNDNDSIDKQIQSRDPKRQYGKQPLLKLLIPNYAAGAIIGKGGSNIGDLQSKYGASIRLSHSKEFYPGTGERIVVLTGEVSQIIDFNDYIIDKVHQDNDDGPVKRSSDDLRGQQVKIVLANSTAGVVIGRGGSSIKALQEETKAKVMITGRDESNVVGERVLTITGNTEQRIEAARQVISKIATDPDNMANTKLKYSHGSYGEHQYNHNGGMDMDHYTQNGNSVLRNLPHDNQKNILSALSQNPLSGFGLHGPPNLSKLGGIAQQLVELTSSNVPNNIKTTVQIQMRIPHVLVGAILGSNGVTIHEFIQFSGAKIHLSPENGFGPGSNERILTILGDLNQTQVAYYLLNQKITQAQKELSTLRFQMH